MTRMRNRESWERPFSVTCRYFIRYTMKKHKCILDVISLPFSFIYLFTWVVVLFCSLSSVKTCQNTHFQLEIVEKELITKQQLIYSLLKLTFYEELCILN